MGQTALLPSEGKIQRLRWGLNTRSWVPKASTLPLDHRSRRVLLWCFLVSYVTAVMDVLVRKCTVRHGTLLSVFCIVYLMNH